MGQSHPIVPQSYKYWKVGLFDAYITQESDNLAEDDLLNTRQIIKRPVALLRKLQASNTRIIFDIKTGLILLFNSSGSKISDYTNNMLTGDWIQFPIKLADYIDFGFQRNLDIDLNAEYELAEIAVDLIASRYDQSIRQN